MAVEKGIIELFGEVVKSAGENLDDVKVVTPDGPTAIKFDHLNYIFGNSSYIKEKLDEYSKSAVTDYLQVPMVCLLCPVNENRGKDREIKTDAKVNIIIACSTTREYSNEERLVYSFQNILRPIYRHILDALRKHTRFNVAYDGEIQHTYSENYSYGRFGAYTSTGEKLSEPIDAIDVRDLELTVNNKQNCRQL